MKDVMFYEFLQTIIAERCSHQLNNLVDEIKKKHLLDKEVRRSFCCMTMLLFVFSKSFLT